ncbi:hypothetical protein ACVWYH_000372 [Bradyrhizobium sp. GM24.11]
MGQTLPWCLACHFPCPSDSRRLKHQDVGRLGANTGSRAASFNHVTNGGRGERESWSAPAVARLRLVSEHTSCRTLLVAPDEGNYGLVIGVRGFSWNGVR